MINSTNMTFIQNFSGEQVGATQAGYWIPVNLWLQFAGITVNSAAILPSLLQMASYFGYSVAVTDLNGDG